MFSKDARFMVRRVRRLDRSSCESQQISVNLTVVIRYVSYLLPSTQQPETEKCGGIELSVVPPIFGSGLPWRTKAETKTEHRPRTVAILRPAESSASGVNPGAASRAKADRSEASATALCDRFSARSTGASAGTGNKSAKRALQDSCGLGPAGKSSSLLPPSSRFRPGRVSSSGSRASFSAVVE